MTWRKNALSANLKGSWATDTKVERNNWKKSASQNPLKIYIYIYWVTLSDRHVRFEAEIKTAAKNKSFSKILNEWVFTADWQLSPVIITGPQYIVWLGYSECVFHWISCLGGGGLDVRWGSAGQEDWVSFNSYIGGNTGDVLLTSSLKREF